MATGNRELATGNDMKNNHDNLTTTNHPSSHCDYRLPSGQAVAVLVKPLPLPVANCQLPIARANEGSSS